MAFPDDFSDDEMLLALCIREEELDDPADWCREARELGRACKIGPKTSDEAHALMARSERLFQRIKKITPTGNMTDEEMDELLADMIHKTENFNREPRQ